jgi:(1->4)-alpha-D-glucan 1-alpha-D-glucosylmutase
MRVEPRATYRLQLRPGFGFAEAADVLPYLADLGVSHVYLSPCLRARAGSTHGYDVVDFGMVNPELGGAGEMEALLRAVGDAGLGVLLDIVPNHMATSARENPWWWDVLENGPSSAYASFFDVDWDGPEAAEGMLVPVLDDHYGRVLEEGRLSVLRQGTSIQVRFAEHAFPAAPRSLAPLLQRVAERTGSTALAAVSRGLGALPAPQSTDRESVERRRHDKEALTHLFRLVLNEEAAVAPAVDAELEHLSREPNRLDAFLTQQNYRLAFWRIAARELPYRRFFDIDQLVALRAEDAAVFEETHAVVLRWLREQRIDGLRVDHVDGLRTPQAYLHRLRAAAPDAWIVVEKILENQEELPAAWPVGGTTGYDFLNLTTGLLVDTAGAQRHTEIHAAFTGDDADYGRILLEKKRLVLRELFGADVARLTRLLAAVCRGYRRDYARGDLEQALREAAACFPVYRTYVEPGAPPASDQDARFIGQAIEMARRARPDIPADLFDLLHQVLLLNRDGPEERELALRFQQLTGPAMAKGAEDTACYAYTRFVALNEVGAEPDRFGVTTATFHHAMESTVARGGTGLLATSTHDTKRSEDVRARLALLSEIPDAWGAAVRRWSAHNDRHNRNHRVDRSAEYLLYQTLVGAWPLGADRAVAYMEKAAREAKTYTSWRRRDEDYEAALREFVTGVLADQAFAADLAAFVTPLVWPGRVNSLAQTLLKLTAPGVPDIYQGCELWDLSLVDPDNRRLVDFGRRREVLAELTGASPEVVLARADDGWPKLWLIRRALQLRARRPDAFGPSGSYTPLAARGSRSDHVVAFMRAESALTVVPRLILSLAGDWADTTLRLPRGAWRNVLTGEAAEGSVPMAHLLGRFPVALLERAGPS